MKYILTSILFFSSVGFASKNYEQLEQNKKLAFGHLLENISRADTPRGFIVASPSKSDPDYYYHWVRDAALVMGAIHQYLPDGEQKDSLFADFIDLVLHHQSAQTLTGLGEPKFNADGTGYSGPWGRPQNDGPALRALTLTRYAQKLTDETLRVKYYTAIKRDLEYVSHNWQKPDFDLWEEVKGTHFYTRMAQRSALYLGADFADKQNDPKAADWYRLQSQHIDIELSRHWSSEKGYIMTTIDRVGGMDTKHSGLDSSVILAVNHAWEPGLSFGPTDNRITKTYEALVNVFNEIYPINSNKSVGAAMGRYPEDTFFNGNPWFLLTHAMAEYLYKIDRDQEAETYLKRSRLHRDQETGRMSEQYNRYSGYMLGANNLTWSYASLLTVRPNEH